MSRPGDRPFYQPKGFKRAVTRHGARRGFNARRTVSTLHGGDSLGSGLIVEGGNPWIARYANALSAGLAAHECGKVRTLADMSPEEKAAIAAEYGCPIKERDGK